MMILIIIMIMMMMLTYIQKAYCIHAVRSKIISMISPFLKKKNFLDIFIFIYSQGLAFEAEEVRRCLKVIFDDHDNDNHDDYDHDDDHDNDHDDDLDDDHDDDLDYHACQMGL